jgi:hypothetical protein
MKTEKPLKLYLVSQKVGKAASQDTAYVEARSPKEAILRYCGNEETLRREKEDGIKYAATIANMLNIAYKSMSHYARLPYVPEKLLWERQHPGHLELSFPTLKTPNNIDWMWYENFIFEALKHYANGIIDGSIEVPYGTDPESYTTTADEVLEAIKAYGEE